MPTIDELLVKIDASTEGLRRELSRADSAVATTSKNIDRSLGRIDARFTALGGSLRATASIFSATALFGFGKQALDAAGGLGELADQLGVTVSELEAFQYAAVQDGASAEQLQSALSILSAKIGEASKGTKEAVEAFSDLGVKILDANGKLRPTGDILTDIAKRLATIEDPAKRATAAKDLLGRSGQRLLPLLMRLSGGLDTLKKEAEEAGVAIGEDAAGAADKAGDAIAVAGLKVGKTAQKFVSEMAPAIVKVLEALTDFINKGRDVIRFLDDLDKATGFFGAQALNRIGRSFVAGGRTPFLDLITTQLSAVEEALRSGQLTQGLREQLEKERDSLLADFESLGEIPPGGLRLTVKPGKPKTPPTTGTGNPAIKGAGDKAAKQVQDLQQELAALRLTGREKEIQIALDKADDAVKAGKTATIRALADAIYTEKKAIELRNDAIERATAAAEEERRNRQQASEDAQRIIADRDGITRSIQREIQDNESLIGVLGEGSRAYREQAILLDILNRYRAAGTPLYGAEIEQAREAAKILAEQEELLKGNESAARELGDAVSTAFEDAIIQGKSLNEVLAGLLQTIAQIILRTSVTKPLEKLFGGDTLSDLFGSIFGGGSKSRSVNWSGVDFGSVNAIAAAAGGIGHYAAGGNIGGGELALVGEHGPELFMPRVPGTIVPNYMLGAMGGDPITINMPIDARGAQLGAAEEIRRAAPAIIDAAVAKVQQKRLRNPNFFGREQGR